MAMSYDYDKNSILVCAVMNWNADMFEAVLSGIQKDLSLQEVRTNNVNSEVIHHMFKGRMHLWRKLM